MKIIQKWQPYESSWSTLSWGFKTIYRNCDQTLSRSKLKSDATVQVTGRESRAIWSAYRIYLYSCSEIAKGVKSSGLFASHDMVIYNIMFSFIIFGTLYSRDRLEAMHQERIPGIYSGCSQKACSRLQDDFDHPSLNFITELNLTSVKLRSLQSRPNKLHSRYNGYRLSGSSQEWIVTFLAFIPFAISFNQGFRSAIKLAPFYPSLHLFVIEYSVQVWFEAVIILLGHSR